jgi:hypothetical protein
VAEQFRQSNPAVRHAEAPLLGPAHNAEEGKPLEIDDLSIIRQAPHDPSAADEADTGTHVKYQHHRHRRATDFDTYMVGNTASQPAPAAAAAAAAAPAASAPSFGPPAGIAIPGRQQFSSGGSPSFSTSASSAGERESFVSLGVADAKFSGPASVPASNFMTGHVPYGSPSVPDTRSTAAAAAVAAADPETAFQKYVGF